MSTIIYENQDSRFVMLLHFQFVYNSVENEIIRMIANKVIFVFLNIRNLLSQSDGELHPNISVLIYVSICQ